VENVGRYLRQIVGFQKEIRLRRRRPTGTTCVPSPKPLSLHTYPGQRETARDENQSGVAHVLHDLVCITRDGQLLVSRHD